MELEEKALNSTEDEFLKKVLPFVKMLNSKVAYAKNKQSSPVNIAFVEFMSESIIQVKNIETFKNFKFLFEAIIGFYEKEDFRKNNFNQIIKNTEYVHRLPFLIDAIFKEDIDGGNKKLILDFVNRNIPIDTQLLVSIAYKEDEDKEIIYEYNKNNFNYDVEEVVIAEPKKINN